MNKYDSGTSNIPFSTPNSQPNRMHSNSSQYLNQSVEDDLGNIAKLLRDVWKLILLSFLGFDPFKETQKALAELINDEATQQQQQQMNGNSGQRARMPPPPGFNHIQNNSFNSFGAASPRSHCKKLAAARDGNTNRVINFQLEVNFRSCKTRRRCSSNHSRNHRTAGRCTWASTRTQTKLDFRRTRTASRSSNSTKRAVEWKRKWICGKVWAEIEITFRLRQQLQRLELTFARPGDRVVPSIPTVQSPAAAAGSKPSQQRFVHVAN